MTMPLRYAIILCCLLISQICNTQTETLLNIRQEPLSPSESRFHEISFDMESVVQRNLFDNPAFYELLNQKAELLPYRKNRSVVSAGYANGQQDGDFLPYEGNASRDMRVSGTGEYTLDSIGTLYGGVQYARGKHSGIGWNAVRHPELYMPYISTDSIGGNSQFEEYRVKGGFSFQLDKLFLGVSGQFRGEQAHP